MLLETFSNSPVSTYSMLAGPGRYWPFFASTLVACCGIPEFALRFTSMYFWRICLTLQNIDRPHFGILVLNVVVQGNFSSQCQFNLRAHTHWRGRVTGSAMGRGRDLALRASISQPETLIVYRFHRLMKNTLQTIWKMCWYENYTQTIGSVSI